MAAIVQHKVITNLMGYLSRILPASGEAIIVDKAIRVKVNEKPPLEKPNDSIIGLINMLPQLIAIPNPEKVRRKQPNTINQW